jgi:hypothetical protein
VIFAIAAEGRNVMAEAVAACCRKVRREMGFIVIFVLLSKIPVT